MIDAALLTERFADFLGHESEAAGRDGRITLLTPAEYPDNDAVAVYVETRDDGRYGVSDLAAADSLLIGHLNPRAAANKAEAIAERFDVAFERGSVVVVANESELPEACWRVAQASAAIAEAMTYVPPLATPKREFEVLVADALGQRGVEVERHKRLRGLSGYEYSASIFVPRTEAVVEPIAGRKAWERAQRVYAEFGDLREVNGYRLVAVLDDRDASLTKEAKLLSQVGRVANWSRHDEWLATVA